MLLPERICIDSSSGDMVPHTASYAKRLSEMRGLFQDAEALEAAITGRRDPTVYEVTEFRAPGSDLFVGTTAIAPGRIANEYYMTRGHFHERSDMAEIYYTQHGTGILLLESKEGESRAVDMLPGSCAFIPPGWGHRSINVGVDRLVFVWVCGVAAGHDYADIRYRGMRNLVVEQDGRPKLIDNPAWNSRT